MRSSCGMGDGLRTLSTGQGAKVPLEDCKDILVASSADGSRLQPETEDNQQG